MMATSTHVTKLMVCDSGHNRIRLVTMRTASAGSQGADDSKYFPNSASNEPVVVSDIGGNGIKGRKDGLGIHAMFNEPRDLCIFNGGGTNGGCQLVFVADTKNHSIRLVTCKNAGQKDNVMTCVVTTIAGGGEASYRNSRKAMSQGHKDGLGVAALFNCPSGIAIDRAGRIFVADTGNHCIRMILPPLFSSKRDCAISADKAHASLWTVVTIAGVAQSPGFADGLCITAQFHSPCGIAVMDDGALAVSDCGNKTVRLVMVNVDAFSSNDAQEWSRCINATEYDLDTYTGFVPPSTLNPATLFRDPKNGDVKRSNRKAWETSTSVDGSSHGTMNRPKPAVTTRKTNFQDLQRMRAREDQRESQRRIEMAHKDTRCRWKFTRSLATLQPVDVGLGYVHPEAEDQPLPVSKFLKSPKILCRSGFLGGQRGLIVADSHRHLIWAMSGNPSPTNIRYLLLNGTAVHAFGLVELISDVHYDN
jgi:hypothetical protein